jgi:2-hydroxychromene-2-carboxylate isomerase
LARNNEDAVAGGVFGVPSFFVGSELFFGNAQR